jgi:hypothetical protein
MQNSGTDLPITSLTCGETVIDLALKEFYISLSVSVSFPGLPHTIFPFA